MEVAGILFMGIALVFAYWVGWNIGYWKGWDRCSNRGDRG